MCLLNFTPICPIDAETRHSKCQGNFRKLYKCFYFAILWILFGHLKFSLQNEKTALGIRQLNNIFLVTTLELFDMNQFSLACSICFYYTEV